MISELFYITSCPHRPSVVWPCEPDPCPHCGDQGQLYVPYDDMRRLRDHLYQYQKHRGELIVERDRLRAEQEWRPIEEGVFDDRWVLVFDSGMQRQVIIDLDHDSDAEWMRTRGFTHFMPLPPAPGGNDAT